jgi:alkanesulfonate monooxygenase SsuD/methylene tetrahydromethanopterin reductase-like flavin-dependent oxidoreductase (luciferase family)
VFNHPLKLAGEIGMIDAISHGRIDVGVARAFLPHEFRRFGIPLNESQARFREGLEQLELLLTCENASHQGKFHSFESTTSLPRPTQKPRPKFYVAATQTPETFELAGRHGYSLMAIPLGPKLKDLLTLYRNAWRGAGHSGNGEVMVAFHMFCHEDPRAAREIARGPVSDYFAALAEVTRGWAEGESSGDYRGYQDSMKKLQTVTLESQIESGGCWVGSPSEIRAIITDVLDRIGPFEHASLQINFSNLPFKEALRSMRLFAREVIPHFATEGAKQVA